MTDRQTAINQLYEAYSNAGDDDENARMRIIRDVDQLIAVPVEHPEILKELNLEAFMQNAVPVTDEELDIAEKLYDENCTEE